MTPNIEKDHAIETYKSLPNIALAGLKLLALLNGGAAVALLNSIVNISAKGILMHNMFYPMGCFLLGLVLCSVAFFFSYFTQYYLYQDVMWHFQETGKYRHVKYFKFTIFFAILSLLAFITGSILSVLWFQT